MTVIVCTDDRGGMLFMKRRVSRDRLLIEDVCKTAEDGMLYISDYSEELFSDSDASVISVSRPLTSAGEGDFVFIENEHLTPYLEKIRTLIIYRFNRTYPFDFSLDVVPEECGFSLSESYDFKGYSHEKITKEIYVK